MIKGFIDEGEESHSPKAQGRWCIVISHLHKSKKIQKKLKKIKKFEKKNKLKK